MPEGNSDVYPALNRTVDEDVYWGVYWGVYWAVNGAVDEVVNEAVGPSRRAHE
jgi:hypothetical protein